MLDRLIDLVIQFIKLGQIYIFVDQYEEGVVLRCGKYKRTVGPGLHWLLPLNFETCLTDNVVMATDELDVQTLTTKDNKTINIALVLTWKITDIRRILLDVEDADDALTDAAAGYLGDMVETHTWAQIRKPEFVLTLKKQIQQQAREWGIKVIKVKCSQKAIGRGYKLWMN